MPVDPTHASLDGRVFRAIGEVEGGEVGAETTFHYREFDGRVEAEYAGGSVARGFLVGTRAGDVLRFRYCQLNDEGETSTGRCESTIEALPDGRLRLNETWAWESRPGAGTSAVDELVQS